MTLPDYPIVYGPAGVPDVPYERFVAILAGGLSPAAIEAHGMYSELAGKRVQPAVFLAFFRHESRYATVGIAHDFQTRNPGNVRSVEVAGSGVVIATPRGNFVRYPSFTAGTRDWAARMVGPKYAGAGLTTVRAVLPRYAPTGDADNNPTAYIAAVLASIESWVGVGAQSADFCPSARDRGL